ncbi:hypothetical protein N7475_004768 [Penicillium sp. IBT 31633x]|nr:hypothetical protein N7475_004768 [Penicillium sp. IBT 31633x]
MAPLALRQGGAKEIKAMWLADAQASCRSNSPFSSLDTILPLVGILILFDRASDLNVSLSWNRFH